MEKVDSATNERYFYIIEKQQVPNVNYQIPGENRQTIDKNVEPDSIHIIQDNKLRYGAMPASESNIY